MRSEPSTAHAQAVEEGARHHESSKTYSGSLMRPHAPYLSDVIHRLGIRSALDYGCGKGEQYRWIMPGEAAGMTVEQLWGFEVFKYDPCWPPYATEPTGTFDLVICTHTLALIPLQDLDWALGRIFGFADKAVFIAEKIGNRKKGEVADPDERAIGLSASLWLDRIAPFADARRDIETVFSSRERIGEATITTRYRRDSGQWVSRGGWLPLIQRSGGGMAVDYARAYGTMHESGKRFPGYSLGAYVGSIGKLIEEHEPDRLLDYGCGKGYQYLARRYHEQWPGQLLPYCYDIGVQQLSHKPEGRFGGVINTDMLEHIEKPDLPGIIDELLGYTEPGGFLFLGISCRPTRKKLPGGGDVHRTIEPPPYWIELVESRLEGWPIHIVAHFDLGTPPHFDTHIREWDRPA